MDMPIVKPSRRMLRCRGCLIIMIVARRGPDELLDDLGTVLRLFDLNRLARFYLCAVWFLTSCTSPDVLAKRSHGFWESGKAESRFMYTGNRVGIK
jgi:hypothetical protein